MVNEVEAKAKVLRALRISEIRISELLGAPEIYSFGITPCQDENSVGDSQDHENKQRQAAEAGV